MSTEIDLQGPMKEEVLRYWHEGYTIAGISRKTEHSPSTVKIWIEEAIAEIASSPKAMDLRDQNRELSIQRLNNLKREAWYRFHSLFFSDDSEKAGQPRARGGHMAATRYMEMILRAEEMQQKLEGLVGPGTQSQLPADGKQVVRSIRFIVTGPDGSRDGARAGALVETTRVLPDEGETLSLGRGDRLGEEPRGSDEGHRLLSTVDQVVGRDPGADEPEPQGHDDEEVL